MDGAPRLEGMHAETASVTGWIEAAADGGPPCLFCGDRPRAFKPLDGGWVTTCRRLWWCQPCETTWAA